MQYHGAFHHDQNAGPMHVDEQRMVPNVIRNAEDFEHHSQQDFQPKQVLGEVPVHTNRSVMNSPIKKTKLTAHQLRQRNAQMGRMGNQENPFVTGGTSTTKRLFNLNLNP